MTIQKNYEASILIADDDVEDRALLTRAIAAHLPKAKIFAAEDGEDALGIVDEGATSFDLIFIDLRMPRMNGIEFLQALASKKLAREATLIVWSGVDDERLKWCAFGLNATLFVEKSQALDDIEAILGSIDAFVEPENTPKAASA